MLRRHNKLLLTISRCSLGDLVYFRPRPLLLCNFATSPGYRRHSKGDKDKGKKKQLSSIVQAVTVKPLVDPDGINVGEELSGSLDREAILKLLNKFYQRSEIKTLSAENGLDSKLFHQAFMSFRRYCVETKPLSVELHVILSDIVQNAGHVDDIFPFFLKYAKEMFPHLECMEDLQKISDLRQPANWYPEARALQRKIIYHAGPTNSGKTYHALDRFLTAKSGVYCGPLRLLANEVFKKSNGAGTPCDLVTGEERRLVSTTGDSASHVACTVEMTSVTSAYEVAVLDEIQMIRDPQRGWAWTRALLGLNAQEVHVCGDESAVPLLRELALSVGNEFEVRRYKRLTPLTVLAKGLDSFARVQPGDAIVCFSKNDIYHVSRQLEKSGVEAAVIYGTLPPGTKIAQAQKFNDPKSTCKVLVSTDAIGMGLNLNIKRVVFYSLMKPVINEKGEKEMDVISPSTALQIAGRAGRFNTEFANGEVTTFRSADLPLLTKLMDTQLDEIERAGLHPTAEQIELFAYHLPKASLSNLIDVFVTVSTLDNEKFFMCHVDEFKFLADMIEHVPLPLRMRYVFCCAPIPKKQPFVCTMFLKFARRVSKNEPVTLDWLCTQLGWPFHMPCKIADLTHLESVFDVLDNYLWLGYRFPDMFPDMSHVRDIQKELDELIQRGIINITQLLHNTETNISSGTPDTEDDYEVRWRSRASEGQQQGGRRRGREKAPEATADDDVNAKELIRSLKNISVSTSSNVRDLVSATDTAFDSRLHQKSPVSLQSGKRLVDQLIDQGIISKDMLAKLQQELTDSSHKSDK